MAVQLHPLLRVFILSSNTDVCCLTDSCYRANRQFPVKFIDRSNPFYLQEHTRFDLCKKLRKLIVPGEHFDHDRIGKIRHRKHDDRLFIPDLAGIKTDDLSPDRNLSHFRYDLF